MINLESIILFFYMQIANLSVHTKKTVQMRENISAVIKSFVPQPAGIISINNTERQKGVEKVHSSLDLD